MDYAFRMANHSLYMSYILRELKKIAQLHLLTTIFTFAIVANSVKYLYLYYYFVCRQNLKAGRFRLISWRISEKKCVKCLILLKEKHEFCF